MSYWAKALGESLEGNYSIKRVQSKFICYAERENNRKDNNFFIRYKEEAMPQDESMQDFCLKNKVPYNLLQREHNVQVYEEVK